MLEAIENGLEPEFYLQEVSDIYYSRKWAQVIKLKFVIKLSKYQMPVLSDYQ